MAALAAVVCNDDGGCWRTRESLTYPPAARVHIYGDDYTIGPPREGAATIVAELGSASKNVA